MSEECYPIVNIAKILSCNSILPQPNVVIKKLLTDSRTVTDPTHSLFFAISAQRDGHLFINSAYQNGIRNFVIAKQEFMGNYPDANFLVVPDVVAALQNLVIAHRNSKNLRVIGITGSNGKTIVKEWLYQLLASDFNIVRSPKSFNSQIGVPLAVWEIAEEHDLGIFEAGISLNGEMEQLANIINCNVGILTNIGEAHAEGFESKLKKLNEKLKLFRNCEILIYSPDYTEGLNEKDLPGKKKFTWSLHAEADFEVIKTEKLENNTLLTAIYQQKEFSFSIPFNDNASIENAVSCFSTLLAIGYEPNLIIEKLAKLTQVSMRLALINGLDNCSIIDDSYSVDISSLAIALDFLNLQNQHPKKTVILSDFYQTGKANKKLYAEISALLAQKNVNRLIGIGENISAHANLFNIEKTFFESTTDFINAVPIVVFNKETILIKGARKFEFERITKLLTHKTHATELEINLNALANNLHYYRKQLQPGVKIMSMVKAFSYGSGSFEIANVLQHQKVDYLAVAYTDEGIALRKAGIGLPIMVMSPEPSTFDAIVKYNLEPEIYNLEIFKQFIHFLKPQQESYPIHLKLDTGMHRLGFEPKDLQHLLALLTNQKIVEVKSVFTHLVASTEINHDEFTNQQISAYSTMYKEIADVLNYQPLRHVLNTSGISRWPTAQFDMVRLGIGLYGFDGALKNEKKLNTVAVLKTTVTQIKNLAAGETVGYGRNGLMTSNGKIATVKIGYADGYDRRFGNGVGKMLINGKFAPTIGSICMDMTMLDITDLTVKIGDEVIVFNEQLTIEDLAKQINTIPYEILTNISQRVKRVYFYE